MALRVGGLARGSSVAGGGRDEVAHTRWGKERERVGIAKNVIYSASPDGSSVQTSSPHRPHPWMALTARPSLLASVSHCARRALQRRPSRR